MGSGAGKLLPKAAEKRYQLEGDYADYAQLEVAQGPVAGAHPSSSSKSRRAAPAPEQAATEPPVVEKRRSRVARDVEDARRWTKAEIEQLHVPQLVRWLEAIGTDFSPAIKRHKAEARLWREVERNRPPALAAVTSPDHLQSWPLPEMFRWLEYFGAADEHIADKETLVNLLLAHGEDLPPPSFLGQSAEDTFITQVQTHVAMVKNAATTLLAQLSRDTQLVEAQERAKHAWHPNGRVLTTFKAADFDAAYAGAQAAQSGYLDVQAGDPVDLTVHEASGWAWCIARGGDASTFVSGAQGWVPASSVVEVAQVLEAYAADGEETLALQEGQEVEVLLRHYSGWTLCRISGGPEGWVPDTHISDHPRNSATKKHRLVLNGLQRLAEDSAATEASFFCLRAQGADSGFTLEGLYNQVLGLVDEYRNICATVQAHAAADAAMQEEAAAALEAERAAEDAKALTALPAWVVEGKKCYWLSKNQKKLLRVVVKKVCRKRRQVLVTFHSDAKARKIVSFDAFADMSTCPLQRSKERARRRGLGKDDAGEAQEVDEAARDELEDDLRELMNDLGGGGSLAGSAMSDSDSDSDEESHATESTASPSEARQKPPSVPSVPEVSSDGDGAATQLVEEQEPAESPKDAQAEAMVEGLSELSDEKEDETAAARAEAEQRAAITEAEQRAAAAVVIQRHARALLARRRVRALRERRSAAATRIQAACRRHRVQVDLRPRFARRQAAARVIQGLAFMRRARREVQRRRAGRAEAEARAATRIQRRARGVAGRERARKKVAAIATIQRWFRGHLARRRVKALRKRRHHAASKIQGLLFMRRALEQLQALRLERAVLELRCATRLQAWWRGEQARRWARAAFPMIRARHQAALCIQGLARMRRAKRKLRALRDRRDKAVVNIQRHCRGHQARVRFLAKMRRRSLAAARIQGLLRMTRAKAVLATKQQERAALRLRMAIKVQLWWQGRRRLRSTRLLLQSRRGAAVQIQRWARGKAARRRVARIRASIDIQRWARGKAARRRVAALRLQRAQRRAAVAIQKRARGLAARRRVAALRLERLRLKAALTIQRVARGFAARRVVRALRRDQAAVKIQAARRRMMGRRRAMQKRAEAATVLLDALWNVQVGAASAPGKFTETKTAAWLEKANEALKFKEQAEQEEAERQLNSQRLAACEGLPGGTDDGQLQRPSFTGGQWPAFGRAMAGLDRGLAAIAAAQARARLRSRALLLTQVGDGAASCDGETRKALLPEEGILARLPLTDAVDEVASLLQTSWVMTVASRGRRVEGIPRSEEILKESITILHRRLVAELGGAKRMPELGKGDIYDEVLEKVTRAEKSATDAAEQQASSVRESSLRAMKAELADAMKEAEALLEAALAAAHKVTSETEKVKKTFQDKADEEEVALRKERQGLHEQTVALHTLAMNTQIEKERLEAELGERKPRARVFQHILATVKELQEQLRVQEVNGTSNRKSQGLLAHTLRALEARATKGMEDCYAKMRADGLVPEVMKDGDDSCIHKFKPSENVRKKVERQEEQEKQFRAALETEVRNMHAMKKAEAAKEAAVLGAQLRAEAEKHCAAVKACVDRLLRWRSAADIVRPWLGSLAPLARTHAAVAAAAEHVRAAGGQGPEASPARTAQLRPVVRAVLRRFESLSCSALRAGESESPRPGKLDQVLGRLHGFQKTIGALCKEFPDVDPEKDFAAAKRLPQEEVVLEPLETELDLEGDALISPVHSPEKGGGARSSKDKGKPAAATKAPNPPGMTGWAGLAALGSELCTLPGGMGGVQPQASAPAPSGAPRGGPPKGPPPSVTASAPSRPQAKAAPAAASGTLAPGAAARQGPRGVAVSPAATPSGSSRKPPAASPARAEVAAAPQAKKAPGARR